MSVFTLDDIKLSAEDGDKLAEIKDDQTPPADPVVPAEPPAPPADTPPDQNPTPAPAPAEPPAPPADTPPATDPPLSPFHEHPDWKKMQERLDAAEKRAEAAEQQARTPAPAAAPDEYAGLSRAQIVEKILVDKNKTGWKPKDQLDYDVTKEDAIDKANNIIKERESKDKENYAAAVNNEFAKLGIVEPADRQKVTETVIGWANRGIPVSLASFAVAVENLKLKGELGAKPAAAPAVPPVPAAGAVQPENIPAGTPAPAATVDEQRKAQDDANRKIARSKSSGGEPAGAKPSFNYIRNTDLDTIVLEQAGKI